MGPLVSIVVPCYKFGHLLPECVNSILQQSYGHFEVLIMDNCSPDNTAEVAQSFSDARVKHIRNDVNIGHLRNFNKGIAMSAGKYVWLISADDYLRSPLVLQRYVEAMERDSAIGYVFCRTTELNSETEVGISRWKDCGDNNQTWDGIEFLRRLVRFNCIAQSSSMVRRECFERVSPFPLDMPYASDWYLWCMFALHYRVAYFAEPMACCRVHEKSLTSSFVSGGSPVCITDELNVLWRVALESERLGIEGIRQHCNASIASRAARAFASVDGRPGLSRHEFDSMLELNTKSCSDRYEIETRLYAILGDEHYWGGEYHKARSAYRRSLKLNPWSAKTWLKYLLLSTGTFGDQIRHLLAQNVSNVPAYRPISTRY